MRLSTAAQKRLTLASNKIETGKIGACPREQFHLLNDIAFAIVLQLSVCAPEPIQEALLEGGIAFVKRLHDAGRKDSRSTFGPVQLGRFVITPCSASSR